MVSKTSSAQPTESQPVSKAERKSTVETTDTPVSQTPVVFTTGSELAAKIVSRKTELEDFSEDQPRLSLDGIKIKSFSSFDQSFLEQFGNLEVLEMNNCSLSSLINFPNLQKLKVLEIQDNKLNDQTDFQILVQKTPELRKLLIGGNRIRSLQTLTFINNFAHMWAINVDGNPLPMSDSQVAAAVFKLLPTVSVVDGYDRDNNQIDDDDVEKLEFESADLREENSENESDQDDADALKSFYTKEYNDDDDEEEEEFAPEDLEEDSDDADSGDDDSDSNDDSNKEEGEKEGREFVAETRKRKLEDDEDDQDHIEKRQKDN